MEVEKHASPDTQKLIVGNKSDLTTARATTHEMAESFAKENGIELIETSAKMNHNVEEMFVTMARSIKEA